MSPKLDIGDALEYGFDRLVSRGGATLLAVYVLLQLASQVGFQSLFRQLVGGRMPPAQAGELYPLAVGLSAGVGALVSLVLLLASFVFVVVALRALYADLDDVPTPEHTRDLARTVAVIIAVSFVSFVAVGIGFVLFVLPGVFLAVSLAFAQVAVAVEDAGVIEALRRSWSLTGGNRVRLFALGLVVVVASGVVGAVGSALGFVAPTVGGLLSNALSSVVTFYGFAVLVGAYRQLAGEEPAAVDEESTAAGDEPVTV